MTERRYKATSKMMVVVGMRVMSMFMLNRRALCRSAGPDIHVEGFFAFMPLNSVR
jgi:hypothetical protein